MKTRLASFSLVAALLLISGCAAPSTDKKIALQIEPNPSQQAADGSTPAGARPKTSPAPADANITPPPPVDTASVLARKTESYAKSVETAMSRRPVAKPQGSQDSLVQWMDPNDFKIGAADDNAAHPAPAVSAQAPSTPAAQQLASAQQPDVKTSLQTAVTQANAGASVEQATRVDSSNTPASIGSEPRADKASAVMSPPESFESRITQRAKDYPRDVSANLDYQMLLFLRDEAVPQLPSLTSLPNEDRELVSAVMDGMSNFRSTLRSDNNMLYSRKIRPLTDLADRLKQQAELSIPTLVLCTRVDGFGRYDPIEPPRFPAQKGAEAIIYCELENFASHENDNKQWQTDVTQEAILYTEDGMQVWQDKTQKIQDLSRNRRHDFFLRTMVKFPNTLTVGRYMLKVTIVDVQANRVAEASLPIQIAAD